MSIGWGRVSGTQADPGPAPLLGSLKTLSQKNSFWVHKVRCQGSEPHLARCPMQVAPPAPRHHACPHGMHAIVSCLPGPAFQKGTGKGKNKTAPGKVSPCRVPHPLPLIENPRAKQHSATPFALEEGAGCVLGLLTGCSPYPGAPRAAASGHPPW